MESSPPDRAPLACDPLRTMWSIAQTIAAQGAAHAAHGRPAYAERLYRIALAILESADRVDRTILEAIRGDYAALLTTLGRDGEATAFAARDRPTDGSESQVPKSAAETSDR